MARVTKAELESLTKIIARMYGYPTEGVRAPKGSKYFYKENFLQLENNTGYYSLMVVLKSSGQTHFGTSRGFTASEMQIYLRGLIDGKEHTKQRFERFNR
ncbi:MAG: hypothetical protein WC277_09635 [Bacilli bacterium]